MVAIYYVNIILSPFSFSFQGIDQLSDNLMSLINLHANGDIKAKRLLVGVPGMTVKGNRDSGGGGYVCGSSYEGGGVCGSSYGGGGGSSYGGGCLRMGSR